MILKRNFVIKTWYSWVFFPLYIIIFFIIFSLLIYYNSVLQFSTIILDTNSVSYRSKCLLYPYSPLFFFGLERRCFQVTFVYIVYFIFIKIYIDISILLYVHKLRYLQFLFFWWVPILINFQNHIKDFFR